MAKRSRKPAVLRKARIADVRSIHALVGQYARRRLMLARSLAELYENVRDFFVFEQGEQVRGCCALHIAWEGLGEVKSLAVASHYTKRGIGRKLVEACLDEARDLGLERVFVLTFVPGFFRRAGFKKIAKSKLPHKIWSECVRCPHFPDCDEVPLAIDL